MPEGDRGFYTNWWNGGKRGDPGWERYDLDELIPLVERKLPHPQGAPLARDRRALDGRHGHDVLREPAARLLRLGGVVLGLRLASAPGVDLGLGLVGGVDYEQIFGPHDGFYATGHNPSQLTDNLRHTRLYVTVGDGTPAEGQLNPAAAALEVALKPQSEEFVAAAQRVRRAT